MTSERQYKSCRRLTTSASADLSETSQSQLVEARAGNVGLTENDGHEIDGHEIGGRLKID